MLTMAHFEKLPRPCCGERLESVEHPIRVKSARCLEVIHRATMARDTMVIRIKHRSNSFLQKRARRGFRG